MLDLYIFLTYLSCIYFDLKHKFRVNFNNIGPVVLSLAFDQCNDKNMCTFRRFRKHFFGVLCTSNRTFQLKAHTLTFNNHYNFSIGFYKIHRNDTHFYIWIVRCHSPVCLLRYILALIRQLLYLKNCLPDACSYQTAYSLTINYYITLFASNVAPVLRYEQIPKQHHKPK